MKLVSSIQGTILVVAVTSTLLRAPRYGKVRYSSPTELPLNEIKLPAGFHIALYVNDSVPNARTMVVSSASNSSATIVYVASQNNGTVHAIVDLGSDGYAEEVCTLLSGLTTPEGILWHDGSLYVFATTTLRRFDGVDAAVLNGCKSIKLDSGKVIVDWLPNRKASRNIVLAPDGYLYVVISSTADVADCLKDSPYNIQQCSISRMRLDGTGLQAVATGIRNVVGLALDSAGKTIYLAQLARELLGDNAPDDLLQAVPLEAGSPPDFGCPYCDWSGSGPPELRSLGPGAPLPNGQKVAPRLQASLASTDPTMHNSTLTRCCQDLMMIYDPSPHMPGCHAVDTAPPVQALGPHVAPLGIKFAPTNNRSFPLQYSGNGTLFIAEHGSYNRTQAIGYRVTMVQLDAAGKPVRHDVFASGWLRNANTTNQEFWGRPANLLFLPDGSLLLSDDFANAVYRITYTGTA